MAISVYQIDNVIKAYNKQARNSLKHKTTSEVGMKGVYSDSITISNTQEEKSLVFDKISYSIRDLILRNSGR